MRTFALDKYNIPALVADCQFCDGDRRLAFRLHHDECGYEDLIFVDPVSGAIRERLVEPADWRATRPSWEGKPDDWLPSDEEFSRMAEPYRGEIILCQDGARLFQRTVDRRGWQWRDRTPDGWRDGPAVPTEELEHYGTLAASADGKTVARVADRTLSRTNYDQRREVWTEVWSVDASGAVTTGRPMPRLKHASGRDPKVAVSSGPRPLVALCSDHCVTVRGLSGKKVADLVVPWKPDDSRGNPKYHVRFSDERSRLVVLFDDTLTTWDTATWTATAIKVPEPAPLCMAVSARGDTVAVADRDGVVRFFDAATGSPGTVIVPPLPTDPKQNDVPVTLCFSRDGTMCLLASLWGAVAIWDVD